MSVYFHLNDPDPNEREHDARGLRDALAMVYIFLCGTYLPHSYFTSHRRDGRLGSLTLLQAQKSLPKIP